ncbi:MAG: type II secretion system ATPase GspE [Candidatus Babeliales bacterium]
MANRDIGSVLVAMGVFTETALAQYRAQAEQSQLPLEQYLVSQRICTETVLAQGYAQLVGAPFIAKITEKMADPQLMAQVPLKFLREYAVTPVALDNQLFIVTANPTEFQPIDELSLIFKGDASVAVATKETILDAINRYYPLEGAQQMIEELAEEKGMPQAVELAQMEEKDILSMATEAPIIKLVNHILVQAVKRNASDIHIEPFEKEVRVRYRVDGVMYNAMTPPKRVQAALVSRIKIMANLNIAEKRMPQDGRIEIKVADRAIDIRVSVLPTQFGERIVMRLLDKSRSLTALTQMNLSERDYRVLMRAIARPNGIIFVSGPTGSGKTSTLYSILNQLNTPEVNIITVEDPVEYQMRGIAQVQVQEKIGLTFAAILRSILRQDPDIVMIGETRDQETAQIAIQAALTGHLVLSTIHTNSAPATITRLIDMGIEPFLIASSLVCVVAQRLVRTLCTVCKKQYTPTAQELESIGLMQEQAKGIVFYQAVGCQECGGTGYRGRAAVFEIMEMTNEIVKRTMEHADMTVIRKQAVADGMTQLLDDGIAKVKKGITTIQEIVRVAAVNQEEVI